MKVAIVTDSNSGITQAEGRELGVFVLPMPFLINGESYYEDINLSQEEFYEKLRDDAASVSTSQPIVGELLAFWDNILKDYDEIVYIPMSSGLSQSCSTAQVLSKDYGGRVHVVDNHRISVTQRLSVYDAMKLAKRGKSAEEIKEYLEKTQSETDIFIMVDTMKYLKKGGRVTPAAAAIGSLLKLKPILQIQGEKLDKFALARTLSKAKDAMIDAIKNDLYGKFYEYTKNGEMVISFAHTDNETEIQKFRDEVAQIFPDIPISIVDPLSLSVSCHIGPGALAITCTKILK